MTAAVAQRVTIGDDPSWTFTAALIDEKRWNGWACPWFTEAEGRKIAAVTQAEYDRCAECWQEYVEVIDEAPPQRRFWLICEEEEYSGLVDAQCIDGVWLYAIGAGNWTWEEADDAA
jgi:hypothetical protein